MVAAERRLFWTRDCGGGDRLKAVPEEVSTKIIKIIRLEITRDNARLGTSGAIADEPPSDERPP